MKQRYTWKPKWILMKCGQESAGAGSGPVAGSFDHDEPMGSIKGKQFFTS